MRCEVYVNGEHHKNGAEKKWEFSKTPEVGEEVRIDEKRVAVIESLRHNLHGRFCELYLRADEPRKTRESSGSTGTQANSHSSTGGRSSVAGTSDASHPETT